MSYVCLGRIVCQRYTLYIADTAPPLKHNIVLVAEGDPPDLQHHILTFTCTFTLLVQTNFILRLVRGWGDGDESEASLFFA